MAMNHAPGSGFFDHDPLKGTDGPALRLSAIAGVPLVVGAEAAQGSRRRLKEDVRVPLTFGQRDDELRRSGGHVDSEEPLARLGPR